MNKKIKKSYKKGGAVVKDLGYTDTTGLTPAQIAVLNGGAPASVENVTPGNTVSVLDTAKESWINKVQGNPFTTAYGDPVTGNNAKRGTRYSGQMWGDWSKIAPALPGQDEPYGEAYLTDPQGGYRINVNKKYMALGGTIKRYSYDADNNLIEDPEGEFDETGSAIQEMNMVQQDPLQQLPSVQDIRMETMNEPIQAQPLPQSSLPSKSKAKAPNKTGSVVQGIFDSLPSFQANTAQIVAGLSAGVNYMDSQRIKQEELKRMRRTLAPVTSPNNFYGNNDMPLYQELGGVVTGTKRAFRKDSKGYTAKDFEVDPSLANVVAENGEFIQFPDGSTTPIYGDKHSDYSGGEYMNLPEGSRIYSDKIKADKEFSADIMNNKTKKKHSISDLAKKFNTDKEDEILNNKKSDDVAKRTASFMKEIKTAKLDEIYKYQEMKKNPMVALMDNYQDSPSIPQVAATGGEIKPKRGGYLGQGIPPDYFAGYSADQVQAFNDELYTLAQQEGYNGDPNDVAAMQEVYFNAHPGLSQDYFTNVVEPTNKARTKYGIKDSLGMTELTPDQVIDSGVDGVSGVRIPRMQNQMLDNVDDLSQFKKVYNKIEDDYYDVGDMQYDDPYIRPLAPISQMPDRSTEIPRPLGVPLQRPSISSNTPPNAELPPTTVQDNKKAKRSFRMPNMKGAGGMFDYLPEAIAAAQVLNDFPIWNAKFQPKYISPIEMNIQGSLDENYAQARPLLQSNSSSPSINNARANQAAANLYGANNQMFQQKYNADTQDRQRVQQYNNQLENTSNQQNLERVDKFWDKVTARQANKEKDINTITNSAYRKAKQKMLEKESTTLVNQMFDNFKYKQGQGVQFVPGPDGQLFTMPVQGMYPAGTNNTEKVEYDEFGNVKKKTVTSNKKSVKK